MDDTIPEKQGVVMPQQFLKPERSSLEPGLDDDDDADINDEDMIDDLPNEGGIKGFGGN